MVECLEVLNGFSGKFVEVTIIGAIYVQHYISKFKINNSKTSIAFGDEVDEIFPFELWKDTVEVIDISSSTFCNDENDYVKLKITDNELVTYLEIVKH